ncbi:MAG TPA: hypothetical protein VNT02_00880 [Burkholderiales bacterium]|nr:hypothetical protein [Burkholderiales bacterium]
MGDTVEGSQSNEPGQWAFWRKKDGCWHWRHTDLAGVMRVSAEGYPRLADCMANAMDHGYRPLTEADEERATAAA